MTIQSKLKALTITAALALSGCYHLQLARSPLPIVYQDAKAQTTGETEIEQTNKPTKSKIHDAYLYILENWF